MTTFKWLKRLFNTDKLLLPARYDEFPEYNAAFHKAVEFTKHCGFKVNASLRLGDMLSENGEFVRAAMSAAGVRDSAKAAGQCMKWSHYLAPMFEEQLGCRVWPTIGQLWKDGRCVFSPSWNDLKRWSNHGIQVEDIEGKLGINVHAWLTVESGEIIEPSFLSTLAFVHGGSYEKYAGTTVWGRDPGVLTDHRYLPMAVGREFLEAIHKHSAIPLLATNSKELHQLNQALVIRS